MTGNPEVIKAMLDQYLRLMALQEQAHQQEHWYECARFGRIARWFHKVEQCGHERLVHPFMNRVNALGGRLNSGYAFTPEVFEVLDLDRACESTLRRLDEIHAGFIAICNAAESSDDYVTERMVWKMQEWVEKQQRKFSTRLEKIRLLTVKGFLQEMVG